MKIVATFVRLYYPSDVVVFAQLQLQLAIVHLSIQVAVLNSTREIIIIY